MKAVIQNSRIFVNALMSVVQVVVIGGTLFVLYKFLLQTIGVEKLGIWSLVLAATSVAGVANLGLSGSVVKFVAKYLAKGQEKIVADVIETSSIAIGALSGLVLLISYPVAAFLLKLVIPENGINEALSILPYALFSLWMTIVASVFLAGLDGYQRIDSRSIILVFSTLFNLFLCLLLVPKYNLPGLAYAQIAQAAVTLIGSWIMLKRYLPVLPIIPLKWNQKLFKEMMNYSLNFQTISITQMLCDPITKALLTKFGGLAFVGFYEMANRLVIQLRSLVVSANQVLVPAIADLHERHPDMIQKVFKDNYRIMFYISLPLYATMIILTPLISEIWIGRYEPAFVMFSFLTAINLFINTLSVPAYFSYLGIGELKWNTLGHVIPAFMNIPLGLMFGYFFGGMGVVVAWIISSATGSMLIIISYYYIKKLPFKELIPSESKLLAALCLAVIFIVLAIYYKYNNAVSFITISIIVISLFSIIVFVPLWLHPLRKRLTGWVTSELVYRRKKE